MEIYGPFFVERGASLRFDPKLAPTGRVECDGCKVVLARGRFDEVAEGLKAWCLACDERERRKVRITPEKIQPFVRQYIPFASSTSSRPAIPRCSSCGDYVTFGHSCRTTGANRCVNCGASWVGSHSCMVRQSDETF